MMKRLVGAAAEAGADAVKTQAYSPEALTLPCHGGSFLLTSGLWKGQSLWQLYEQAQTPWEWQKPVAEAAKSHGLHFLCSPFSCDFVDKLEEEIEPPAYKVASFELLHVPLLERIAATGKPLILSTGMASEEEIAYSLKTFREAGGEQVCLLKCVSSYPALAGGSNLRAIATLRERFGVPVGLSDHTLGHESAIAATALGACIIEKHLCLDRNIGTVDAAFSLEPHAFKEMVQAVHTTWSALGDGQIEPSAQEAHESQMRRSIFAKCAIAKGERFTEDNLVIARPAAGLSPMHWKALLGKASPVNLAQYQPLPPEVLQ